MADYNIEDLKFLIVDDNKNMRGLVRDVLVALGVKSYAFAGDGDSALNELQQFSADIIICDWHMIPIDGIEFTRQIRNDNKSSNRFVPIIMLTAHTERNRVAEARDAGVNEFLAKPISAKSLYSRIRSVIENPRQFVHADPYLGPDRRRRNDPSYSGREQRKTIKGTA